MKMLLPAFIRFEMRRVFGSLQNRILFGLLIAGSVYFVFNGIWEYRSMEQQRHDFQLFERNKVQLYLDYSQYGEYGFRIFFQPNPISVFFNSSAIIERITSNIDTMEIVNVQRSYKGRNLFGAGGFLRDYAGLMFYLGSLIMLAMGSSLLVSRAHLSLILSRYSIRRIFAYALLSRLLILNAAFFFLQFLVWLIPKFNRHPLTPIETSHFFLFTLYSMLFFNFFFFLGSFIAALARLKRPLFPILFVLWIALLFVLPEFERLRIKASAAQIPDNDMVNIQKMESMIDLEKRIRNSLESGQETAKSGKRRAFQFMGKSYRDNLAWEDELNKSVEGVIGRHEAISALIPTLYYPFLTGELSGGGFHGYLAFMEQILRIQDDFIRFYMRKRYGANDARVESFVSGDENVFAARSHLPESFPLALGLLFGASLLLLWATVKTLERMRRR